MTKLSYNKLYTILILKFPLNFSQLAKYAETPLSFCFFFFFFALSPDTQNTGEKSTRNKRVSQLE